MKIRLSISEAGDHRKRMSIKKPNTLFFKRGAKATNTKSRKPCQSIFSRFMWRRFARRTTQAKSGGAGMFAGDRPDGRRAYVRLRIGEKMPRTHRNL